jgi:MYXO-CTERM domain-containing protein
MNLAKSFFSLTILGVLTLSAPAWADVPPDDACFANSLGQSCRNATDDGKSFQPGVCKEALCTRASRDGSITYACYRCLPLDEGTGTGGQPNEAGGVGGASDAAGDDGASKAPADGATSSSDDGGGCSVSHARGGAGVLGTVLALLGFTAAGRRRRRSLRS